MGPRSSVQLEVSSAMRRPDSYRLGKLQKCRVTLMYVPGSVYRIDEITYIEGDNDVWGPRS